jgi:hypothetical protein
MERRDALLQGQRPTPAHAAHLTVIDAQLRSVSVLPSSPAKKKERKKKTGQTGRRKDILTLPRNST